MAKWCVPNEVEQALLVRLEKDPEGCAVNRVGQDYLVFLWFKTRETLSVCLYEMRERGEWI